jgi:anti-anti-sigma regulatory factor
VLKAHQAIAKMQGKLVVTNFSPHVCEIFDPTGLFNKIRAIFRLRLPE